jgi:Family of unknown function (DUF6364)
MKNITVSVPDDVYRAARNRAAERGTSVSSLVSSYLRSFADQDADLATARASWSKVAAEITNLRGGDRLGREKVHERTVR